MLYQNKRPNPVTLWILFLWVLTGPFLFTATGSGFKFINNFETGLHSLNWSVLQDKRGVVYSANNGGVIELDSGDSNLINIPNSWVRSLALGKNGIIYVGGVNELGYLSLEPDGSRRYFSLIQKIKPGQRNFATVWRINTTTEGVYFRTSKYLFRWNPVEKNFHVWEPTARFNASFTCNGTLYIHQRGVGLMKMENETLNMIPGRENFASARIYMMVSMAPDSPELLIGTRSKGLFIHDGKNTLPLEMREDDFLKSAQLSHGVRLDHLPDHLPGKASLFALATLRGGLLIIDAKGQLVRVFNKTSGLADDNIKYVNQDRAGNLWLAMDRGLAVIEYTSPLSFYNEERGALKGNVNTIRRHGPKSGLYAGTSQGLYRLHPPAAPGKPEAFRPVPGISAACFDLVSTGPTLLAATIGGVYSYNQNTGSARRITTAPAYVLFYVAGAEPTVLAGLRTGLVALRLRDDRWIQSSVFQNITQNIRTIVRDPDGGLWLGTMTGGVIKVNFPSPGSLVNPVITRYKDADGLESGEIRVFDGLGHVTFASGKKIFRFNENKKRFISDKSLGEKYIKGSANIFKLARSRDNRLWFHSEFWNYMATPRSGEGFNIDGTPFLRLSKSQVDVIYPEPSGQYIWMGGSAGLVRFETGGKKNYKQRFNTLIRDVKINGKTIRFTGGEYLKAPAQAPDIPVFRYRDRNISFRFSGIYYENPEELDYSVMLEGYDREWSEWSKDSRTFYTNLDSGVYTFRVKARNTFKKESEEASYRFRLLPPWFKTWWAFFIYGVLAFIFVFFVVRWRSAKLERDKRRLEQTVKDRTRQIDEKNRQLENQTHQLLEQSDKLKEMDLIKSRFFANISHEFRTPLTLIMGPLEQMLAGAPDSEGEKKVSLMMRSARRLLHLINQLLDLSKLDGGKMAIKAAEIDIIPYLKRLIESFRMMAEQKQIELSFHSPFPQFRLYFDPVKMEDVMCNLLINAIKFTPAGGRITVSVRDDGDSLAISVADTGVGISREQLEHIFDRFYQAGSNDKSQGGGTGIGLALARELVLLHHGAIAVASSVGKDSGSDFMISLRKGKDHFQPHEIASSPAPFHGAKAGEVTDIYGLPSGEDHKPGETEEEGTGEKEDQQDKELILVVEDNADARLFIRQSLEPYYRVKEAADGKEGIQRAREIIPDLIVSDVMMPEVDGYQLCKTLKKDIKTSHVPIILLTAKAAEDSVVEGLETGADDYVTKPFSTPILLARIRNLILLRRSWQQKIQRRLMLQPEEVQVSDMDQKFIKEVQEVIEKNLSDTLFGVVQMGKALYMSRATLYRKILALTGQSPREFIKSYRLKRGAQLLKDKFGNVTEVAFETGFSSTAYFTKCFKEQFHQLPSEYEYQQEFEAPQGQ